jgi:hypothetical protein
MKMVARKDFAIYLGRTVEVKLVVVRNKSLETMSSHKVEMMEGVVRGDFEKYPRHKVEVMEGAVRRDFEKYSRHTAELEEWVTRNQASRSAAAQKTSGQSGFWSYLGRQLAGKDTYFEIKASRKC